MRKGKLGVVVCLYPILGFVCVILNQPLLCALIFGFVLVAEYRNGQLLPVGNYRPQWLCQLIESL